MRRRSSSRNDDSSFITQHSSFQRLEQRLVLLAWLNGHFGYEHNRDLLADMKEAGEGFDAAGRSYVYHRLEARGAKVKIPLAALRKEGFFHWSKAVGDRVKHPYMQKMGVSPAVFVECDLVDTAGPLDVNFAYQDRAAPKSGDYYYLRVEQLNTAKAWSSPVWIRVP